MTDLLSRLGLSHPIISAPMAGGTTTPTLVAAVSSAGALGSLGAAYLDGDAIVETATAIRALTDSPFAMNVFAPTPPPRPRPIDVAVDRVAKRHAELGLKKPVVPNEPSDRLEDQIRGVLEVAPAVLSFTFGTLPAPMMDALKGRGIVILGTATTVAEAQALEALGVDAVIAQGSEAGGHRGTFAGDFADSMVGTIALVPQVVDAVTVPVIASGGIMDGRGIAAALVLGAQAVQMGTAFMLTEESGAAPAHKAAVLAGDEGSTRVTAAFSGRPARGLVNEFMDEIDESDERLDFPLQNDLTRSMRRAAAASGRTDLMSLWSGQGVRLARSGPAAELVAALVSETEEAMERFRA